MTVREVGRRQAVAVLVAAVGGLLAACGRSEVPAGDPTPAPTAQSARGN